MLTRISPYPQFDSTLVGKNPVCFDFSFPHDGEDETLDISFSDDTFFVFSNQTWRPEQFGLHLTETVKLSNTDSIFTGETAVVSENAVIGVALRWQLPKLGKRGVTRLGEIRKGNQNPSFSGEMSFESKEIRTHLILETVAYLISSPAEDGKCFAKTPGSILSILDRRILLTGGTGSGYFPVKYVEEDDGQLLWYVESNWEDLSQIWSDEVFTLNINRNHSAFPLVFLKGDKVSPLLFEIFADACVIFLQKVLSDETFKDMQQADSCSIAGYANNLCEKLFSDHSVQKLMDLPQERLMKEMRRNLLSHGMRIYGKEY